MNDTAINLAKQLSTNIHIPMEWRVDLLTYLQSILYIDNSNLTDVDVLKLKVMDEYVNNSINMSPYITLDMCACHFTITLDKAACSMTYLVFVLTPNKDEKEWWNPNTYNEIHNISAKLALTTNVRIQILIKTGWGNAKVIWYNPFKQLLSIKYIEDTGGYSVCDWSTILKYNSMAKRAGY
jgi:hypothetical protein